ncbi:thioredoxin, putative [Minicystis rosea]|nr:thioredoxin, putative [Minicystis rosea]
MALLVLTAIAGCAIGMPASFRHPLKGAQAPSVGQIEAAAPTSVGIPGAGAVKVTVIDFWASWCPGCQDSLPQLDALYREKRDAGLRVVGVSLDERPADAYALTSSLNTSFPVVVDDGKLAPAYSVSQIPLTFVVDASGTVRWVGREPEAVRAAALALLAE